MTEKETRFANLQPNVERCSDASNSAPAGQIEEEIKSSADYMAIQLISDDT